MKSNIEILSDISFALSHYKWTALSIVWLTCAIAWLYVYSLPDVYEAHARVYLDTQSLLKPLLKGLAVDSDVEDAIALMTKAVLSRPNLEKIARETDLDLATITEVDKQQLLDLLARDIVITMERGAGSLYNIVYTNSEPTKAYAVVKAVLDSLMEQTLGASRSESVLAQSFLRDQTDRYETALREAEEKLAAFKKKHIGLLPGDRGGYYERLQAAISKREAIGEELREAMLRRDELRRQLQGETRMVGGGHAGPNAESQRLNGYLADLKELKAKYTDRHPAVVALMGKISALKEEMASSSGGDSEKSAEFVGINEVYQTLKIALSEAEVKVASLRQRMQEQDEKIAKLQGLVDTIPQVEADLKELNRGYEVTKSQYLSLKQRMEMARISREAEQSSDDVKFNIIDPPIVPLKPIGPNRMFLLMVATGLSIGCALGVVYLLFWIHPVVYSVKTIDTEFGLPVYGVVSAPDVFHKPVGTRIGEVFVTFLIVALLLAFIGAIAFNKEGSRYTRAAIDEARSVWAREQAG